MIRYLKASAVSGVVLLFFLVLVYPRFGDLSMVVGVPLVLAPWFYFYRRRPAPQAMSAAAPTAPAVSAQTATLADAPSGYHRGQTVACQQCGRSLRIDTPLKNSAGKIVVSSVDDMMPFAFRCRQCDYITCTRCSLLAYEIHNPRQGIPTCPACGKMPVGFFTEWLAAEEREQPAADAAAAPSSSEASAGEAAGSSASEAAADSSDDAVQHLLQAPYTIALYVRVREAGGRELTCFIVHEEAARIRALPLQVPIEVRAALIDKRAVGVVVVLLRVGGELYETYWNYQIPQLRACFQSMVAQDAFLIRFYADSARPVRTLSFPNPLRESFAAFLQDVSARPPWSMEQFDAAKTEIAQEFPSVQALWNGLNTKPLVETRS